VALVAAPESVWQAFTDYSTELSNIPAHLFSGGCGGSIVVACSLTGYMAAGNCVAGRRTMILVDAHLLGMSPGFSNFESAFYSGTKISLQND
jgi:hypothetical protein